MVGAGNLGTNESRAQARAQGGADQEVIDAPPDIAGARAAHLAPPGVVSPAFLEFAKGVDESRLDEGPEPGALLGGEPVVGESLPDEDGLPMPEASDSFNDYRVLTGWGANA